MPSRPTKFKVGDRVVMPTDEYVSLVPEGARGTVTAVPGYSVVVEWDEPNEDTPSPWGEDCLAFESELDKPVRVSIHLEFPPDEKEILAAIGSLTYDDVMALIAEQWDTVLVEVNRR